MSRIRFFLTSLLIVWSAGFSLPGFADDTELYLQQAETIDDSVRPNILFVFDKSGSMGSKDVTTASGGTETRMDALKGALTRLLSEGSNDAIKNVNIGLESFTSDPPSTTNGIWNTPILYPVKNIDAPLFSNLKFSKPALASSDDAVESGNADKAVTVNGKILEMTASQGGDALAQSTVVEAAVSASNEDAVESLFSRTTTVTGTTVALALGTSATNTTSEVYTGLMFSGLNIPKDATITGARLLLTGYATSCNCALTPVDLEVKGFLTTQKFASNSSDISSRAATTASVSWNNVPAWGTDIVYSSPDLSPVVQELINTAALSSSNSLGFRIVRTPAYTAANPENASNIGRRFYSYDESTTKSARLQISYTLDTDPTAPDTGSAAGLLQEFKTAQLALQNTADDAFEYVGKKVSGDTTVTWSAKYKTNDAVESKYTGHVDTGRTPYLGYDSGFSTVNRREIYTGLRFSGGSNVSGGVGIPKNAVISSAVLTFTPAANATTSPLNLTIKGFAHDNTPAFAGNSQDISGRATTAASVAWNDVSNWSKDTVNGGTRSPDISVIVQELVNRSGWSSSSALGLVIARKAGDAPTSGTVTSGSGRSFYDDGSAKATTLTITYSLSAAGADAGVDPTGAGVVTNNATLPLGNKDCNPNVTGCALQQLVGLRFVNLPVSKAAKVMKAEIQTQVKTSTGTAATAAANIQIYTENTVNAPAFATTSGNLSSRLTASADPGVTVNSPVTWSIASDAGLTVDEKIYTPSLSALLQPLVDTATWNDTSNAVTFLLGKQQAGGGRAIYDYTDSTSKSAKLNLSWLPAMPAASNQIVGLRFPDVVIPKKAKVTSARLVFTSGANTAAANLKIKGLLGGEAAPFVATPGNISSRTATTGEVAWNDTTPWVNGQRYTSPDLTAIVQEIVNSADWCGGYAMGFKITADAEEQLRNAVSFDGNPGDAPTLEFEYDSANLPADTCMQQSVSTQIISVGDDGIQTTTRGGSANDNAVFISGSTSDKKLEMTTTTYGGSTIRIVGFRFQKIPVSKNSEVLSARLVFNSMADDAEDAALIIKAENPATGTSASFSESTGNFSNRTMTAATVNWPINGASNPWQNGAIYESPDLTALVQEVVNNPKWVSKNNMSFFISGTGLRTVAAFDQSPALAATLIIKVRGSLDVSVLKKVRTLVLEEVLAMQPDSYTPVVDALMEAAYYFRGETVTTGANNIYGEQYVSTGPAPLYWLSKRRMSHYLTFTSADRSIQGVDLAVDTKDYGGTRIAATEKKCTEQMVSTTYPTTCGKKILSIAGDANKTPVAAKYLSPISSRCQPNHIVLMTDGEPTFNKSAAAAATLTGTSCNTGSNNGRCGPEVAKFLYTQNNGKDAQGREIPNTTVKTHTVAFKLDATGGPYLKSIATAGGGGFYAAETAEELVTAFRSIIAIAMTESTSFAAPSLSVNAFNKLYHDNEVYFALFKPEHKITWAGNVKKFKLCDATLKGTTGCSLGTVIDKNNLAAIGADGKLSNSALGFWTVGTQADGGNITQGGAGAVIPSPDTRKIYTNPSTTAGVDLTAAGSALTVANTAVTSALLTSTDIPITDTTRPALINWIRGYSDATTTPPVVRSWRFGDPLHSSPTVFSYKNGAGTKFTKILAATNEGAIRLLNADTGVEEWMYIPKEMLAIQAKLRENAASSERLYGIDGKPALWIQDNNNNGIIETGDKIYAFIGMRRGGRNIYALDLTPNTDGSVSPKLMWTIYGGQGDFANLGQTWSTPLPVSVNWTDNKRKTVLLFGGGYDDATQDESQLRQTTTKGNSIYMVDPLTGARLWWAGGSTAANLSLTNMDYAIPSDLAVMDSEGDGLIDRIYVGDTGGQLWRIDFNANHQNGKKGVGGRLAAIADGTSPENIRRFFYPPDITRLTDAEYSPDAPNFDLVVIGSGYREHPLNVTIQDRLYGFRDRVVAKLKDDDKNGNADVDAAAFLDEYQPKGSVPLTNRFFTLNEEYLYDATTDVFSGGVDQTTLDGAKLALQRSHGWYVKLAESSGAYAGEKSLARPLILKGVAYFTTFTPPGLPTTQSSDSNVCMSLGEGVAKVYAIGIQNAGTATNLNETDGDERSVVVGAGIPAEVIPIYLSGGDGAGEIALGVPTGGGFPILPGTVQIGRETVYWLEE